MWYLGNRNATIGKLDPDTGEIVEFSMPEPDAKDPHTGEFDGAGRFWFTLQHSNRVGQLDPSTGAIKLVELDRPRSRPYGIKIDADGHAWVACNGGPCLYRFDGETMTQTRIDLPNQESRVRRLDIADDGIIWYNESGMRPDALVRFDPEDETFQSWPIPSSGVYAGILRHMRATTDGDLLIHQSATNHIMRVSVSEPAGEG
jgi:virginiamycin B lyase